MPRLTIAEARALAERTMQAIGHTTDEARIIADHLIDCELRGLSYGGLPRALSIVERITKANEGSAKRAPIRVESRTPVSALVHGGDNVGYLVALKAMEEAIARAKQHGIAIVGSNQTWYTGMLSYYAERITAEGFVCMIASNATPWVAPYGGTEGRFGTNPICYGFPAAEGDPIIWDIGTSTIMHAEVVLHQRLGTELPEGRAFGPDGKPTRDPHATLNGGAIRAWGDAKGSGPGHRRAVARRDVRLARHAGRPRRIRLSVRRHEPGAVDGPSHLQGERVGVCGSRAWHPPRRRRPARAHALRALGGRAAQAGCRRRDRGARGSADQARAGRGREQLTPLVL